MKTTIVIFFTIGLLIAFDIITMKYLESEMDTINNYVDEIIIEIENSDFKNAQQDIDALVAHWEENKPYWNMLCDHSEVEAMSMMIMAAKSSFEQRMYDDCVVSINSLKLALEFSGGRYALLFDNIF